MAIEPISRRCLIGVLASPSWVQLYNKARVKHLLKEASDHAPILLLTIGELEGGEKPSRFFQAWTRDPSSFDVVKGVWNSPI